jgi:hypothetical protein
MRKNDKGMLKKDEQPAGDGESKDIERWLASDALLGIDCESRNKTDETRRDSFLL